MVPLGLYRSTNGKSVFLIVMRHRVEAYFAPIWPIMAFARCSIAPAGSGLLIGGFLN